MRADLFSVGVMGRDRLECAAVCVGAFLLRQSRNTIGIKHGACVSAVADKESDSLDRDAGRDGKGRTPYRVMEGRGGIGISENIIFPCTPLPTYTILPQRYWR
jgi:hypothetical protein